jgi:chemotaxis protein histidine kinase CheA/ActR/RegA family two-component response regulator
VTHEAKDEAVEQTETTELISEPMIKQTEDDLHDSVDVKNESPQDTHQDTHQAIQQIAQAADAGKPKKINKDENKSEESMDRRLNDTVHNVVEDHSPQIKPAHIAEIPQAEQTKPAAPIVVQPAPAPMHSALDDETREIFQEEFTEQLAIIHENLALWDKQTDQVSEALPTIRRAFHTLKGSGRMVGATALGDFAWIYEDVLNQVLGGVCQPNRSLYNILAEAWQGLQAHTDALLINNQLPDDLLEQQTHIQQWLEVSLHGDQIENDDKAADDQQAAVSTTMDSLDPEICESLSDELVPLLAKLTILQESIAEDESRIPLLQTQIKSAYALLLPLSNSPLTSLFGQLSKLSAKQWQTHTAQQALQACLLFVDDYLSQNSHAEQLKQCEQLLKSLNDEAVQYDKTSIAEASPQAKQPALEDKPPKPTIEIAEKPEKETKALEDKQEDQSPQPQSLVEAAMAEDIAELSGLEIAVDVLEDKPSPSQPTIAEEVEELSGLEMAVDVLEDKPTSSKSITEIAEDAEELSSLFDELNEVVTSSQPSEPPLVEEAEVSELEILADALLDDKKDAEPVAALLSTSDEVDKKQPSSAKVEDDHQAESFDFDIAYILADLEKSIASSTIEPSVLQVEESEKISSPTLTKPIAEPEPAISIQAEVADQPSDQAPIDATTRRDLPKEAVVPQLEQVAATEVVQASAIPDSESQLVTQLFLEDVPELLADLEQAFDAVQQCAEEGTLCNIENIDIIQNLERQLHTIKGGARMANFYDLADQAHGLEDRLNKLSDNVSELESALPSLQLGIDKLYGQFDNILYKKLAKSALSLNHISNESADVTNSDSHRTDVPDSSTEENQALNEEAVTEKIPEMESKPIALPIEAILQSVETAEKPPESAVDKPIDYANTVENKHDEAAASENYACLQQLRREIVIKDGFDSVLAQLIDEQADELASLPEPPQQTNNEQQSEPAQNREREMIRLPSQTIDDLIGIAIEMNVNQSRLFGHLQHLGSDTEELTRTVTRLRQQLRALDMEIEAQIRHGYNKTDTAVAESFAGVVAQDDFDPLELDEYAEVQQLSRQLSEGLNDLINLEQDISSERRRIQQLLGQQSDTGRDMQQALLNTRMTAIEQIIPRLKRVVRQTADSLGKQVDFQIEGADSELDRVIIQSMLAPLEHMIRNAVSHGIETPDVRLSKQKPEQGVLHLSIQRHSAEIVMILSDDGQGIHRQRVREIAIEQQLIQADDYLSDNELCRLILRAGFTTSEEVDQISGRGIGMDVVYTAIKNMGGSLSIESALPPESMSECDSSNPTNPKAPMSVGTRFIIHLPLTLATNQVLIVEASGQAFALPMNNIVGLQRLSSTDLKNTIEQSNALQQKHGESANNKQKSAITTLRYQHQDYRLQHLGELVGRNPLNQKQTEQKVPIVFLQCDGAYLALQLDNLIGNREIILKPLPNWAEIPALYATASIQPDGEVILVLNIAELVHWRMPSISASAIEQLAHESANADDDNAAHGLQSNQPPTILVVDDSITVRKVTEKFLLANHYRVLTAKDGMDALELLAQEQADLILLDIEMPRMDGFELMAALRGQESYQDLPVIMISSRSGEKHSGKAKALGVNAFLGKPYQEDVLLQTIQNLLLTQEK